MSRITLVVAALLLTNLGGIAAAAENSEHQSKNAQRVLVLLNSLGVNDSSVKNLVGAVEDNIHGGYLNLASHEAPGGSIHLRYRLNAQPYTGTRTAKRLELEYTPEFNKHLDILARRDSVTVNYHLTFK